MPVFSFRHRIRSFGYAFAGIGYMFRTQHNAWVHLAVTLAVIIAGFSFDITGLDWRWIVLAIAIVWLAEAFNTAIEHVCDVVSPEFHASVKRAKDIGAGAVLITAYAAVIIGAMVFAPYLSR